MNNITESITPLFNTSEIAQLVNSKIKKTTTVEEFNNLMQTPNYKVSLIGSHGDTALMRVVNKNKPLLIEPIIKLGGESLFLYHRKFVMGTPPRETAMHMAMKHNDDNAYPLVKKMLQLGSPVNLMDPEYFPNKTPLNTALQNKLTKCVILLLRNGGTSFPEKDEALEIQRMAALKDAESKMMYENEKLFIMHFSNPRNSGFLLPKELLNLILSTNIEVELQD